jgi:hypothetical protein
MHPEAGRYSSLLGGNKRASAISIFQIGGQIGYGIGRSSRRRCSRAPVPARKGGMRLPSFIFAN